MRYKGLAYICFPFRGTQAEINRNIQLALYFAKKIKRAGYIPFVPHISIAAIMDRDDDDMELCLEYLAHCDVLIICGGRITIGMKKELEFCLYHDIPIMKLVGDKVQNIEFQPVKKGGEKDG